MNNVLITSAGRRVSLVKFFKAELNKLYPSAKLIALDSNLDLSPAAKFADSSLAISKIGDHNYTADLLSLCIKNNVKLIVPTIDTELEILSKNRDQFLSHGIEVLVSDHNFIKTCNDKRKTHVYFKEKGIETPRLYTKANYNFPLFIKPINGSNSVDNYLVRNFSNLCEAHLLDDNLLFFEYIDPKVNEEFTCDVYYNRTGILKCVIPRKRLEIRGGEVSKGLTQKNILIEIIKEKLSSIKGARGCITMQFFVNKNDGNVKGIEINPRFGGGFPLSYLAGGNYPKWIIEEYFQKKDIESFDNWEENLLMLRYDSEILVHGYQK